MIYKEILEEDILTARSYVPLGEKVKFIDEVARRCFEKLEIRASDGGRDISIPPMYKENMQMKSRYMMGALVKMYLGQQFEPIEGETWLMSQDDYDRWSGGHVLNQIERMKQRGGVLRDKAFDLLQDYRDLEKRLNTEVYGLCNVMNDPCHRLMLMIQLQSTPESMQKAVDDLKQVQKTLKQYQAGAEKAQEKN